MEMSIFSHATLPFLPNWPLSFSCDNVTFDIDSHVTLKLIKPFTPAYHFSSIQNKE